MQGYILPFPKKGDLGLAKNYWGITLTFIAAKIYNALQEKTASSWQRKEAEGTPQKTITDADYADDIAILANTPDQAETL